MAAWRNLDFDFGVYKNHPIVVVELEVASVRAKRCIRISSILDWLVLFYFLHEGTSHSYVYFQPGEPSVAAIAQGRDLAGAGAP